jgi:hypothetical protein
VRFKARLLPPARASLPGGYDFARDAWFARLGAVGNVLGRIEVIKAPVAPGLMMSAMMALDRGRNALTRRIDKIVGGDAGAIAAAMVTGKRDLLSEEAKEIIREAGIFHINFRRADDACRGNLFRWPPAAFGAEPDAGAFLSDQEMPRSLRSQGRFFTTSRSARGSAPSAPCS